MDWGLIQTIATVLFGGGSVVGFVLYYRANKRIKDAEVKKTETEADEAEDHRFDNLLKLVDSLTQRLSDLNGTVDKHIGRNRELSDRLYKSETGLNRANERITELTAELGEANLLISYLEQWRCERTDCKDERGRKPPNKKLSGLKYDPPKRAVK